MDGVYLEISWVFWVNFEGVRVGSEAGGRGADERLPRNSARKPWLYSEKTENRATSTLNFNMHPAFLSPRRAGHHFLLHLFRWIGSIHHVVDFWNAFMMIAVRDCVERCARLIDSGFCDDTARVFRHGLRILT